MVVLIVGVFVNVLIAIMVHNICPVVLPVQQPVTIPTRHVLANVYLAASVLLHSFHHQRDVFLLMNVQQKIHVMENVDLLKNVILIKENVLLCLAMILKHVPLINSVPRERSFVSAPHVLNSLALQFVIHVLFFVSFHQRAHQDKYSLRLNRILMIAAGLIIVFPPIQVVKVKDNNVLDSLVFHVQRVQNA